VEVKEMSVDVKDTLAILEKAIKVEKMGIDFYQRAEKRTSNAVGKGMFKALVGDEESHARILQVEYDKVSGGAGWVKPDKAAQDRAPRLSLFPAGDKIDIPPKARDFEVLQLAIDFEKRGNAMYREAATKTTDLAGKSVLNYLADWENKHLDMLQKTLNQLSADGTWLMLEFEKPLLDGA
jgi:rubrerythrin